MPSALPACEDCGVTPQLDVRPSRSGWYLGAWCACGPVVRESDYFAEFEEAEAFLYGAALTGSAPAVAETEVPWLGVQLDLFGAPVSQAGAGEGA